MVFCLHGGGYTGLTWALLAARLKDTCQVIAPDMRGHGLSMSNADSDLSASTLAEDVAAIWNVLFNTTLEAERIPQAIATNKNKATNESADKPIESSSNIGDTTTSTAAGSPILPPPTLLVGHSMGGAIAVHAALLRNSSTNAPSVPSLEGIVVIDVVEGTAMASLPFMQTVLQKRPGSFPDPNAAVEWALETGFSRCPEAAAVSVPSMLVERRTGSTSSSTNKSGTEYTIFPDHGYTTSTSNASEEERVSSTTPCGLEAISEGPPEQHAKHGSTDAEAVVPVPVLTSAVVPVGLPPRAPLINIVKQSSDGPSPAPAPAAVKNKNNTNTAFRGTSLKTSLGQNGAWVWRTPLKESAQYWEGWYRGLSSSFLSLKIPKMLILAGTDRLDRDLTIGQMQGKFQLVLLSRAGHAVHEDEAEEVAAAVAGFIKRFRVGQVDKNVGIPGSGGAVKPGESVFRVPMNKPPQQPMGGGSKERVGSNLGPSRLGPGPNIPQIS